MRRMLLLASAIAALASIAVVLIVSHSVARRAVTANGSGGAVQASPPALARALPPASRLQPEPVRGTATEVPPVELAVAKTTRPVPGPGSAHMILTVDPETGRLGLPEPALDRALTIEELQALARAEAEGLVTVVNPDGSETLNHEGRFADHSIVRLRPDGTVTYGCVHGEGELEHALRAPMAVKPAAEEE